MDFYSRLWTTIVRSKSRLCRDLPTRVSFGLFLMFSQLFSPTVSWIDPLDSTRVRPSVRSVVGQGRIKSNDVMLIITIRTTILCVY
jgi:hypothetical protein